jgi:hypothetical protein
MTTAPAVFSGSGQGLPDLTGPDEIAVWQR